MTNQSPCELVESHNKNAGDDHRFSLRCLALVARSPSSLSTVMRVSTAPSHACPRHGRHPPPCQGNRIEPADDLPHQR
jgi:hypothetical protein